VGLVATQYLYFGTPKFLYPRFSENYFFNSNENISGIFNEGRLSWKKGQKPAFLKIFDSYDGYKNQNILKCGGIDFETFFGELFQFHCTEWLQTFYKIYFRGYLDF